VRYSEASARYAKALHMIADGDADNSILNGLRGLGAALEKLGDDKELFFSPLITSKEKWEILSTALSGQNSSLLNFIELLIAKNRFNLILEIVAAYQNISDDINGVTRGSVEAAAPLTQEERRDIEELISRVTKKKAILEYKENTSLIGGVFAQVAGHTFDDTIETQLTLMSEQLKRRAH